MRKLRRGHWSIQQQLDLHGMRCDEAREALAAKRGWRCIHIIHGKGLVSKVRNWLVQKDEVLAFCQATSAEGGSGALLVLLKGQT